MNRLEIVRSGYGLCQLIAPRLLAGGVLGVSMTPRMVVVIRVLGARHLVQGLITLRTESGRLRHVGGCVDVLHALSMIGAGVASSTHRRAALADAVVAGAFATLELHS